MSFCYPFAICFISVCFPSAILLRSHLFAILLPSSALGFHPWFLMANLELLFPAGPISEGILDVWWTFGCPLGENPKIRRTFSTLYYIHTYIHFTYTLCINTYICVYIWTEVFPMKLFLRIVDMYDKHYITIHNTCRNYIKNILLLKISSGWESQRSCSICAAFLLQIFFSRLFV